MQVGFRGERQQVGLENEAFLGGGQPRGKNRPTDDDHPQQELAAVRVKISHLLDAEGERPLRLPLEEDAADVHAKRARQGSTRALPVGHRTRRHQGTPARLGWQIP